MKNKTVHILTFIGIIVFIIPASLNSAFIPIVLLLMGINLFNSSIEHFKSSKGKIILLTLFSLLPILIFFIIRLGAYYVNHK